MQLHFLQLNLQLDGGFINITIMGHSTIRLNTKLHKLAKASLQLNLTTYQNDSLHNNKRKKKFHHFWSNAKNSGKPPALKLLRGDFHQYFPLKRWHLAPVQVYPEQTLTEGSVAQFFCIISSRKHLYHISYW